MRGMRGSFAARPERSGGPFQGLGLLHNRLRQRQEVRRLGLVGLVVGEVLFQLVLGRLVQRLVIEELRLKELGLQVELELVELLAL